MNFPFAQREMNRIALRMARSQGRLEQTFSHLSGKPDWMLMVAKNNYRKPVETVSQQLAQAMIDEGYLQRMQTHVYCLSAEALNWAGTRDQQVTDTGAVDLQPRVKRKVLRTSSGKQVNISFNACESPLMWLRTHRGRDGAPFITEAQFCAGEILRRDYTLARLDPSVTFKWHYADTLAGHAKRRGPVDGLNDNDAVIAGKQRVRRALQAAGVEYAGLLFEVCCLSSGLGAAERRLGLVRRSGKIVLRNALERLAEHYRLAR